MTQDRPFKEIHVANYSAQKRKDRYPAYKKYGYTDEHHVLSYTGQEQEDPQMEDEPPRISLWRSNLVALSQRFNLYFVACRETIYCYVPMDLKQTIPSTEVYEGNMEIWLPETTTAEEVGGYINPVLPHCVNHMIVGNLGNLEILLVACDDGDIIAYYTHLIWDEIQRLTYNPDGLSNIKPFFLQNVGMSAWGLAIHQQSRLIAVSSNLHEVTVFAHAYSNTVESDLKQSEIQYSERPPISAEVRLSHGCDEFPTVRSGSIRSFRDREFNYRIVRKLDRRGSNIPTVDFTSDADGEAENLLAADIHGNLWILRALEVDPLLKCIHAGTASLTRGWGILSIPPNCFRAVGSPQEASGSRVPKGRPGSKNLDITSTVEDVRDSSMWHPSHGYGISGPGSSPSGRSVLEHESNLTVDNETDESEDEVKEMDGAETFTGFTDVADDSSPSYHLSDRSAILRCYSHDIELLSPLYPERFGVELHQPLKQNLPFRLRHLMDFDRLNLVALIPELSLLLVGSQVGRVALLSLTRDKNIHGAAMFRLDLILPFKHHEDKDRPACPLLGMAVSPLQKGVESADQGLKKGWGRRWRLMLHYYDHTILSYELGREDDGGNGLVVD